MDKRRVRIADIAEELGVSTATVSNVIHGKTKKISDETVKRVQELLEKRQYIPSMAGILLAQNDSRIEGCQFGLGESRIDFMQIPMIQKERRQFYQEKASCMLRHSAIFAASDYYAAELIYFLAGAGIHVPGDISVVGFDDIPLCGHMYPPLTSVKQDVMLRARQAVRVLNQLKAGICESTVIKMPVSLVKRESVKQLV